MTLKNTQTQAHKGACMHITHHIHYTCIECYFKVIDLKWVFLLYVVFVWPPQIQWQIKFTQYIYRMALFHRWLERKTYTFDYKIFNLIKCTRLKHRTKPMKRKSIFRYKSKTRVQYKIHILCSTSEKFEVKNRTDDVYLTISTESLEGKRFKFSTFWVLFKWFTLYSCTSQRCHYAILISFSL